ncbi:MAG TPA: hypothetical protein VGN17_00500 [Bryobacteraceae bacterium]|jgi:hypothetical protein
MPKPKNLATNKGVGELARKAGISITTASRKLGAGKTPEQIIAEAEEYRKKQERRSEQPEAGDEETFYEAQRRKEIALASLRELELQVKQGDLAPIAEVNAWVAGMIVEARNILLRIAPDLRDRLAIETDPAAIDRLIAAEVDRALAALAQYPTGS